MSESRNRVEEVLLGALHLVYFDEISIEYSCQGADIAVDQWYSQAYLCFWACTWAFNCCRSETISSSKSSIFCSSIDLGFSMYTHVFLRVWHLVQIGLCSSHFTLECRQVLQALGILFLLVEACTVSFKDSDSMTFGDAWVFKPHQSSKNSEVESRLNH